MSQKEEDKKVKRTIKNSPLNQNPQNFQKSDEIMKTELASITKMIKQKIIIKITK